MCDLPAPEKAGFRVFRPEFDVRPKKSKQNEGQNGAPLKTTPFEPKEYKHSTELVDLTALAGHQIG